MNTRKLCAIIGIIVGVITDGWLRYISGNEGNLLVHCVIFVVSGFISAALAFAILKVIKQKNR